MPTKEKLALYLDQYLAHLRRVGLPFHVANEEGYKFRAVDTFQKNFNLEAPDLSEMLGRSIESNNLVGGAYYFPRAVLIQLAALYPEDVRVALRNLFDEAQPVTERVDAAEAAFEELHARWRAAGGKGEHTFIGLRFLSLLLAFRYPEKHNAMKPREWRLFCREVSENFRLETGATSGKKYEAFSACVDVLQEEISGRPEMANIRAALTEGLSFKDEGWRWLTQDVIYVTARIISGARSGDNLKTVVSETAVPDAPEDVEPELAAAPTEVSSKPLEFPLEDDLERFIIRNWEAIDFGEPLLVFRDEEGTVGQQYVTDVGILDILATDKDGGFVVIELKRGAASYHVVGQILAYMTWVAENLANGKPVRGIIVARPNAALEAAHRAVADRVRLCQYEVGIKLL